MKKLALIVVAVLLSGALAQDSVNVETRLSIVENRLGRLEADVSRLSEVPTSLARIEEKVTALAERSSGNSNVLQQLAMTVVVALLTGGIGLMIGRNRTNGGK